MSTYAIGDIQGCFEPLMRLLNQIHFKADKDSLWFTGDLVNRGPQSLETLRFIQSLGSQARTVLGNHDLTLLAVAYGAIPFDSKHHTFGDILAAPDKTELIDWLRHQPLIHHDAALGYAMVHAGLYPKWDLALALSLAQEVAAVLQGPNLTPFLVSMFGNKPDHWDPQLSDNDRLRFITNCFTRLRFCSPEGQLELATKESAHSAPAEYLPWFSIPNPATRDLKILFGHWAALEGHCPVPNVFALDTGCVWGHCLTAMRLEDGQLFRETCPKPDQSLLKQDQ